jgi:hypothetical protein
MPNILQLMVRRGSHAMAHYSMENRHDIYGLDVLKVRGEWPEWSKRTAPPCEPCN